MEKGFEKNYPIESTESDEIGKEIFLVELSRLKAETLRTRNSNNTIEALRLEQERIATHDGLSSLGNFDRRVDTTVRGSQQTDV